MQPVTTTYSVRFRTSGSERDDEYTKDYGADLEAAIEAVCALLNSGFELPYKIEVTLITSATMRA